MLKMFEDEKTGLTYALGKIKEIENGKMIISTKESVQVPKKDANGNVLYDSKGNPPKYKFL